MKWLIALFLLVASCAGTTPLKTEAFSLKVARDAVAELGKQVSAAALRDYETYGSANMDAAHRASLDAKYKNIVAAFNAVRDAIPKVKDAIAAADARGATSLTQAEAAKLLDTWGKLSEQAASWGLKLPDPPASLLALFAKSGKVAP